MSELGWNGAIFNPMIFSNKKATLADKNLFWDNAKNDNNIQ